MTRKRRDRQRAEATGRFSENLATWYLRLKGFRVLSQRYKSPLGEIDIVAKRGRLLVFAEVKARHTTDNAIRAISKQNQRRVIAAADAYLALHPHLAECDMRYDIIGIAGWRVRHIPQAWHSDD